MADVEAGFRTPGSSGQISPAATTTKLRDSCQACAMSKVKCPKEKPTCSRCKSRSIPCQYVFTRRPGRRRQAHRQQRQTSDGKSTKSSSVDGTEHNIPMAKNKIQPLQPSFGACLLSPSTTPCISNNEYLDMSPQSLSIPTSPRPDHLFDTESSEEISMFSSMANFSCDGNDLEFIMSAMDSPFEMPALDNEGITQARNDIESLLIPPQGINVDMLASEVTSSFYRMSDPSKVTARGPDIQVLANARPEVTPLAGTTPCGCLTQSLDLLKTLSAQADSQPYRSGSEHQKFLYNFTYASSHSVLTENRQSIETVAERLSCTCCDTDNFLLAVLSMTVLKILERYAAAAVGKAEHQVARMSDPEAESASKLLTGIHATKKDEMIIPNGTPCNRERNTAQIVLSELHRVQRLVSQLSQKLKLCKGEAERAEAELGLWGYQSMTLCRERVPAAPFSATTLGQMESDVRKSLSALSSEIITGLRQH